MMPFAYDHPGPEKADPGENALDERGLRYRRARAPPNSLRLKRPERSKVPPAPSFSSRSTALQVAVEADCAAGQRSNTKAQHDLGPIQQVQLPSSVGVCIIHAASSYCEFLKQSCIR
jgi:hypothetical protein